MSHRAQGDPTPGKPLYFCHRPTPASPAWPPGRLPSWEKGKGAPETWVSFPGSHPPCLEGAEPRMAWPGHPKTDAGTPGPPAREAAARTAPHAARQADLFSICVAPS